MSSHKILIVDDHPLFLNALSVTLETTSQDIESNAVGRFSDMTKWLSGSTSTDLVLLDLELPDVPNILGVAYLRALHPNLPVIVVSAVDDDQTIQICRCLGVCGFIPKSSVGADVRDIVELALAGEMSFPETVRPNGLPTLRVKPTSVKGCNSVAKTIGSGDVALPGQAEQTNCI